MLDPAGLERRDGLDGQLDPGEPPFVVVTPVGVAVGAHDPDGSVCHRGRLEEVPGSLCRLQVVADRDGRPGDVVEPPADRIGHSRVIGEDRVAAVEATELAGIEDRFGGEELPQRVEVEPGVAGLRVAGFQLTDRVVGFEPRQPFLGARHALTRPASALARNASGTGVSSRK